MMKGLLHTRRRLRVCVDLSTTSILAKKTNVQVIAFTQTLSQIVGHTHLSKKNTGTGPPLYVDYAICW